MSSSAAACAENLSLVPPGKMTLEGRSGLASLEFTA